MQRVAASDVQKKDICRQTKTTDPLLPKTDITCLNETLMFQEGKPGYYSALGSLKNPEMFCTRFPYNTVWPAKSDRGRIVAKQWVIEKK